MFALSVSGFVGFGGVGTKVINDALEYIRRELRDYLQVANTDVIIDSVHVLREDALATGAYISLVNVEQESALRNTEHVMRQGNQARYIEPAVFVNLYVLFAFSFQDYGATLLRLSQTIELFQSKRVFSAENETTINPFPTTLEKLVFDLHNLNIEQLNHLWGVLGGTYLPSVLYKMRLLQVQREETTPAPEIQTIQVDTGVN